MPIPFQSSYHLVNTIENESHLSKLETPGWRQKILNVTIFNPRDDSDS